MIKNYIKIIFRNFARNKLYSLTNFLGLAVAMMGFITVSLYVNYELSYDKFHDDVDEVYMLRMRFPERKGGFFNQIMPPALGYAIKEELPGVEHVAITGTGVGNVDIEDSEGGLITEPYYSFEPSFFDVFSFSEKFGDARKALSDPTSIVISRELALKHFQVENVIGKTLKIKDMGAFRIGAVLNDFPHNSQFQPHLVLPLEATRTPEDLSDWGTNIQFVYLKVPKTTNLEELKTKITALYTKNYPEGWFAEGESDLFPFKDSYWEWSMSGASLNNRTQGLGADKKVMVICSSLAIVILIIALANYVNMSTSRAIQRAKEVGVRKVNGASPKQLVIQFLSESVVFSLISLLLALIGVELILPSVSQVMGITLELDLLSLNQIGLLFGYALACGLIAGVYPAIFMSRFNPARVLKNKVMQSGKKLSLFKVLLGLQFTLSAVLITGILILNAQLGHYINFDLGFEKDQVVSIGLPDQLRGNAYELMDDLKTLSGVEGLTFGPLPSSSDGSTGVSFGDKEVKYVSKVQTDENFLPVMQIELVAGRNFDPSQPSDFNNGVIINQKLADALELDQPIGASVSFENSNKRVIGVVADFYVNGATSRVRETVIIPRKDQHYRLLVKLNNAEAFKAVEETYAAYDTEGLMKYTWLDEAYNQKFHRVSRVVTIINGSTALTVFVSVFGLFAMLAFSISNRLKEIGVRKVLGARFLQLQWSIAKPFLVISLISLLIAIPLGYYLVGEMIKNYPNQIDLGLGFGLASLAVVMLLNFSVVAVRGITVANLNPVDILKDE